MIDIGANLVDRAFADDLLRVLLTAHDAGVEAIVVTGTQLHVSAAALRLCNDEFYQQAFQGALYATAGIHPHHAALAPTDLTDQLITLANEAKTVAIGETGLDFYRNLSPAAAQEKVFIEHLQCAARAQLPVFVHDRDSEGRTWAILREHRSQLVDVVVHCFTGTAQDLERYLELDCHIGITGWICDQRRGQTLLPLLPNIPSSRLMIETDAPYLLPETMKKSVRNRRNEPRFLPLVAGALAAARAESVDDLVAYTRTNSQRFFRLDANNQRLNQNPVHR